MAATKIAAWQFEEVENPIFHGKSLMRKITCTSCISEMFLPNKSFSIHPFISVVKMCTERSGPSRPVLDIRMTWVEDDTAQNVTNLWHDGWARPVYLYLYIYVYLCICICTELSRPSRLVLTMKMSSHWHCIKRDQPKTWEWSRQQRLRWGVAQLRLARRLLWKRKNCGMWI